LRRSRRLSLEELAPYLLEGRGARGEGRADKNPVAFSPLASRLSPLNWRAVFGNDHPVEVEVGFGKGLFLIQAAQACPQVNFLGIEITRKYQLFTATRLAKRALGNVRLVKADARLFLRDFVAAESCQALHVYFPDPWWKKRHLKRRVFTPEFAMEVERVLRPGGQLHVVTDVEDYFQFITDSVGRHTRLREVPPPEPKGPAHDLDYLTNFERKFRKEGRAIYRASYEKLDGSTLALVRAGSLSAGS
jgi:tRNA (guanine-N7-)-methyltransferase